MENQVDLNLSVSSVDGCNLVPYRNGREGLGYE